MAINAYEGKFYSFQFEQFIKYICSLFLEKDIKDYFFGWLKILNELDNISLLEYKRHMKIRSEYKKKNRRYEIFTHEVNLLGSDVPYIFHYDIEQISSRISFKNFKRMKTKELIKCARYDNSELLNKQQLKKSPIIIVPFVDVNRNYLVIDGNKRLTYRVQNHKMLTKFILLNDINNFDFIFSCDWAMYLLYYELDKCLVYKENIGEFKVVDFLNSQGFLNQQKFISIYEDVLQKAKNI